MIVISAVNMLSDSALDWAVALTLDAYNTNHPASLVAGKVVKVWYSGGDYNSHRHEDIWSPSNNWAITGPLVDKFNLSFETTDIGMYHAWQFYDEVRSTKKYVQHGNDALEAILRCFVSTKFGDWIDLPEIER